MSEYVLRARGISKKYGDSFALQNVNIEIKRGQIYGLVGQNGAGKTTFMRAVTGLISTYDGELSRIELEENNYYSQSVNLEHIIGECF